MAGMVEEDRTDPTTSTPAWLQSWRGSPAPLVRYAEAQQLIGVETAPVGWIAPDPPHAFARVQHQAARTARPGLWRLHFAYRPLHPGAIHDDVRIFLIGRAPVGGKDVTACIDTPGHQITYGCAGESRDESVVARPLYAASHTGSFVPQSAAESASRPKKNDAR